MEVSDSLTIFAAPKTISLMTVLNVYWNYYFGQPQEIFLQICKAEVY
jgi:hypothetical protein